MTLHTPESAGSGQIHPCSYCHKLPHKDGHDGCLGELNDPNIMNACCGHGNSHIAYIQYWDKSDIRGDAAIAEQQRLKAGDL